MKRTFKKVLALGVVAALAIACFAMTASAASTLEISAGTVPAVAVGSNVIVPINQSSADVAGGALVVTYDPSLLTFVKAQGVNNDNVAISAIANDTGGTINIAWFDNNVPAATYEGTIINLTFTVAADITESTPITLASLSADNDPTDNQSATFDTTWTAGAVEPPSTSVDTSTVTSATSGVVTSNGTSVVTSATSGAVVTNGQSTPAGGDSNGAAPVSKGNSGSIPPTGDSTLPIVALAAVIVMAGGALLVARKRRA